MKKNNFLKAAFFTAIITCFGTVATAQCSFTGLDEFYCHDDDPTTLVGTPGGGTFIGSGVDGSTFDPTIAGHGEHVVSYGVELENEKYYLRAAVGEPWGSAANTTAMDLAFGSGEWIAGTYEGVDASEVFDEETGFVFMEGSDNNAIELAAFLSANITLIENWVYDGGRLLLNAAPNESGDIDFGFGGSTLVYADPSSSVDVVDLTHPAYQGPYTPVAAVMTGSSYSHGHITGTGFTNVLVNSSDATNVVLCEKGWGAGLVMMGGMTTNNFHTPLIESANYRANLLHYLGNWTSKFYLRSNVGEPWSSSSYAEVMDLAFGAGHWTLDYFESLDPASVFSSKTSFVYIDGSDFGASGLADFLADNITIIEDWVYAGGSLLMNAAPNEGGNIDFGFDGTTLVYADPSGSVDVNDLAHPAYLGPHTPTINVMTGSNFSHAHITGSGFTPLLVNSTDVTNVVLCEKEWGFGNVIMGGMTASEFHSPLLEASNYRANIMVHLLDSYDGFVCVSKQNVTVLDPITISYTAADELFGSDATINVDVTGGLPGYTYDWDIDGTGDFDDSEDLTGLEGGTYVLVVMDDNGCTSNAAVHVGSQVSIETETQVLIRLYPNPTANETVLELDGAFAYQLYDMNGKVVFNGNGFDKEILDLSNLEDGVYFVQVSADALNQTIKIVKK